MIDSTKSIDVCLAGETVRRLFEEQVISTPLDGIEMVRIFILDRCPTCGRAGK